MYKAVRNRGFVFLSVCIFCLLLAFTGPGRAEEMDMTLPPIPEDLTGGRPWIDSCIAGNVTADTPTSPKEDFYLYANRDWILSSEIPEGSPTLDYDVFAAGREKVQAALAGATCTGHDAHQA
ncbi:MAG: hypothetical protein IJ088_10085 [Clostridia bacterium]|nr:hypothetical protein [Clostridia bacterium]